MAKKVKSKLKKVLSAPAKARQKLLNALKGKKK